MMLCFLIDSNEENVCMIGRIRKYINKLLIYSQSRKYTIYTKNFQLENENIVENKKKKRKKTYIE